MHFCICRGIWSDEMHSLRQGIGRLVGFAVTCALLGVATASGTALPTSALEDGNWTMPAHGYDGNRYVKTSLLTRANVAKLQRAWSYSTNDYTMMETAPVVSNGTVYVTSGHDDVYALDAKTGAERWVYQSGPMRIIGLAANRGVAYDGGKIFLGTLDGHVVALDASSGRPLWKVLGVHDPSNSFYTMAPIVYRGQVMIGVSDGDWGGIGYVTGFDERNGRRLWEWQTIPYPKASGHETWGSDGWKRGGGAVWGGLTLDPVTATLYFNTGNPEPDLTRAPRGGGDNLYTDSMIALDVSGRRPQLRWYHQFVAHDTHDWDSAMPPVMFTGTVRGSPRALIASGDKAGNFWVLDRANGALVYHLVVSLQRGQNTDPSPSGTIACPSTNGGVQYNGGSYLPETNLFYVPSIDQCGLYKSDDDVTYSAGDLYFGGDAVPQGPSSGWMNAIDIGSGRFRWRQKLPLPALGGALSLSSGIVFSGQLDGELVAYDATNGRVLWHAQTGSPIKAPPTTYVAGGKRYVVVASGAPGRNWKLPGVPPADAGAIVSAYALP